MRSNCKKHASLFHFPSKSVEEFLCERNFLIGNAQNNLRLSFFERGRFSQNGRWPGGRAVSIYQRGQPESSSLAILVQIVAALKVHPDCSRYAQCLLKAVCNSRSDIPVTVDKRAQMRRLHSDSGSKVLLLYSSLDKFALKHFPRMNADDAV